MSSFPPNWENLERSLRDDVAAAIPALLASKVALRAIALRTDATINAAPATTIKELNQEVRDVLSQVIRLTRLIIAAFDTGDIGT